MENINNQADNEEESWIIAKVAICEKIQGAWR